jgi:iron-sulfur cluster assembly protein
MSSIELSPAAIQYYQDLLDVHHDAAAIRFSIRKDGCAGWQYDVALVQTPQPGDLPVITQPITVYLCPTSAPKLLGTKIDFVRQGGLDQGRITFTNPQATAHCGCEKSFSVNEQQQEDANEHS